MIAIIDYRAGNLTSVKYAFEALRAECLVTADPLEIARAERIVFPGVGAAGAAMHHLSELGLLPCLRQAIRDGKPFLGICVGTQVLFEASEEDGGTTGLGILPGRVRRFRPADFRVKVPHMGWNQLRIRRTHPLFEGIPDDTDFYFVHSYYPDPADPSDILGTSGYAGVDFAAMVGRANVVATQFHTEKSGQAGLRMLANFVRWDGVAEGSRPC